ncbi:diaminopimelate epimerase [bacterium]|nr:diaminopimelate epimerase [bacterium]
MIYKLHSLHNDFLISDQSSKDLSQLAAKLCNRKTGFGADCFISYQIVSTDKNRAVIKAKLYNQDGSQAYFSGNGFSCLAKLIFHHNPVISQVEVLCHQNKFNIRRTKQKTLLQLNSFSDLYDKYKHSSILEHIQCFHLDVGNEHAIIFDSYRAKYVQSHFENTINYPNSINIDFVNIISRNKIKIDVIERGCGRTDACSSGALASVIIGSQQNLLSLPVLVQQRGGDSIVDINKSNDCFNIELNPILIGKVEYEFK